METADSYILPAIVIGIIMAFVLVVMIRVFVARYVKVGPDEALIVSGRKRKMQGGVTVGFRIVRGGATFVWPVLEVAKIMSLRIMPLDVMTASYTSQGVQVSVEGIAQVKIDSREDYIATAAEQFLSMPSEQIGKLATQTLEGHLRSIIGTLTVEQINQNRDAFAQKVQEVAATDLANMGLTIISFTIKEISDKNGYLQSLGKAQIARVQRDAVIGEAEAQRDATIGRADAQRDADIRSAEAAQVGQTSKYIAETKIAEASRDKEMKTAEYQASINAKKAEADLSYDKQKFVVDQEVQKEAMQVEIVKKQKEIELQEQEVLRREKELEATIRKPAEADKFKVEIEAEAEKIKREKEAEGQAAAIKFEGLARAEAIKAAGLAEAEVIRAKGEAEAQAMLKKAEAYKQFNNAAIAQMVIEQLPQIAASIAQPLSKTEKIIMIGDSGASKITKDVTNIVAQIPETVKSLTGIDLVNMIQNFAKENVDKKTENK